MTHRSTRELLTWNPEANYVVPSSSDAPHASEGNRQALPTVMLGKVS